jgi:ribulose-phosphate 3-epimerase
MLISPSIASANPLRLEEEITRVHREKYEDLHIDIEDGNFIPNITFGLKTVKAMRKITNLPFSFHLMVSRPQDYVKDIVTLNPSIIFAHVETLDYILDFLRLVQSHNVRCGLAFNPKTQVEPYMYALEQADGALIMMSEPDGRGQEFIPAMIEKAERLNQLKFSSGIWADGGIVPSQIVHLKKAGVTHAVMGRAIFGKEEE